MWRVKHPCLACLVVAATVGAIAGCARTGGGDAEAVDVRTTAFSVGADATLIVESDRGVVEIRGEPDRETIDVKATIRVCGPSVGIARERIESLELQERRTGRAVRLGFHVPTGGAVWDASVGLVVRVPVRTAIDVIGGEVDVTVGAISGTLGVAIESGAVVVRGGDLERLSVVVKSGDVEVSGRLGGDGVEHEVRTGRGDVHLRIPLDSRLRIEAEAPTGGSITSALPLLGDTGGRAWSATLNFPHALLRVRTDDGQILLGRLHET